jgi:hypothetical protein
MQLKAQLDDAALSAPKQIKKHYYDTDAEVSAAGNKKKKQSLMREKNSKQRAKSERLSGKSASIITVNAGGGMQTHTQTPSPHRMRSPDPTLEWETTDETRFGPETTDETPWAPYETTVAPDETTVAPDETTIAPDETTFAPEETTVAPDETTFAPYGAPYETTVAPDETTIAPDETAVAPDETTFAPDETTVAPDETTVAPDDEITVAPDDETTVAPDEAPSGECTNLGELVLSKCPGCCGGETPGECAEDIRAMIVSGRVCGRHTCGGDTPGECPGECTKLDDGFDITCYDAATLDGGSMCRESIQCA